jgi:hypothetical protein
MKTCDLAVAYRIYPQVADAARGFPGCEDKLRLSEVCLRSFKNSLGNLRVKMWVILDDCPSSYAALFRKFFEEDELVFVPLRGAGNQGSFAKQLEVLLTQTDSEVVYFAEDDYLYVPGQFHCMTDFLRDCAGAHFISPYDHLDCYTLDLHRQPKWLRIHNDRHWRTASSTCLTFLTMRETLRKTQRVFRHYKRRSFDCSLWLSLTKQRVFNPLFFARHIFRESRFCKIVLKSWLYCWQQILFGKSWTLWVPIPGIATHVDCGALSPSVDWCALAQEHIQTAQPFSVCHELER